MQEFLCGCLGSLMGVTGSQDTLCSTAQTLGLTCDLESNSDKSSLESWPALFWQHHILNVHHASPHLQPPGFSAESVGDTCRTPLSVHFFFLQVYLVLGQHTHLVGITLTLLGRQIASEGLISIFLSPPGLQMFCPWQNIMLSEFVYAYQSGICDMVSEWH